MAALCQPPGWLRTLPAADMLESSNTGWAAYAVPAIRFSNSFAECSKAAGLRSACILAITWRCRPEPARLNEQLVKPRSLVHADVPQQQRAQLDLLLSNMCSEPVLKCTLKQYQILMLMQQADAALLARAMRGVTVPCDKADWKMAELQPHNK